MKGRLVSIFLQAESTSIEDLELRSAFLDRLNDLVRICLDAGLCSGPVPLHLIGPFDSRDLLEPSRSHLLQGRLFSAGTPILQAISATVPEPDDDSRDAVLFFSGFAPLLDVPGSLPLIRNHLRYRTHYSYSDTAVPGCFPDCISFEFSREAPDPIQSSTDMEELRAFVFRNIQDFDLDLHLAEPDLRMFRLRADAGTDRSRAAARLLLSRGVRDHSGIEAVLREEMSLLAPSPSWIEIEWTTQIEGRPAVYPSIAPAESFDLSVDVKAKILSDLERFSFKKDVTVCIGGRGDPFLGDGLREFVTSLGRIPAVRGVMIETPGTGLTRKQLESVHAPDLPLTLIVRLPSLRADRYREWMGSDRLQDVLSLLDRIAIDPLPYPVYVEMIRLADNEDELDGFMERYGERHDAKQEPSRRGVRALVGKYSRFGGSLPDRAAVDLSPLVRDYCRHLAFELFVNARGRIPLCRQNPDGPGTDLMESDLLHIFSSHREALSSSMKGRWDGISPLCSGCDDWYVFNG